MRAPAALVLLLFLGVTAAAQQSGSEDPETGEVTAEEGAAGEEAERENEGEEASGDYSREALSLIFLESEENEDGPPDEPFTMRWQDWVIRWIPLMMPLEINDGSGGPTLNQWPDPMTLLRLEDPLAGPAGDEWSPQDLSWGERRWRWRMIQAANRANAAENSD